MEQPTQPKRLIELTIEREKGLARIRHIQFQKVKISDNRDLDFKNVPNDQLDRMINDITAKIQSQSPEYFYLKNEYDRQCTIYDKHLEEVRNQNSIDNILGSQSPVLSSYNNGFLERRNEEEKEREREQREHEKYLAEVELKKVQEQRKLAEIQALSLQASMENDRQASSELDSLIKSLLEGKK